MIFETYGFLTLAYVMFALVLSGGVKGVFGIGFPVVAMATLPSQEVEAWRTHLRRKSNEKMLEEEAPNALPPSPDDK